jgi:hypothetical protein
MADSDRHPGITMHKLPVGGGFAGLLFAVGSALIFVLGLPSLWYFVAFSAVLGVVIAVIFRLVNSRRSERMKPLSIVATNVRDESAVLPKQNQKPNRNFHGVQATYTVSFLAARPIPQATSSLA